MRRPPSPATIGLQGLWIGASQVWRGVRIVPLLRDTPIEDLRLDKRCYDNPFAAVGLAELAELATYTAFVPHAFACGSRMRHVARHRRKPTSSWVFGCITAQAVYDGRNA
jgi:hypothetical protein